MEAARKCQIQTETSLRLLLWRKVFEQSVCILKNVSDPDSYRDCGNLLGIENADYTKEIATSPLLLLELLHYSGDSQRRDLGKALLPDVL